MKGVVLGIRPDATVVDISHDVPAQDIPHGAFVLGTTCGYFPPDAVHVAVVDPGVGTPRIPLLLTTPTGAYVAPDNGVLTYVLMACGAVQRPDTSESGQEDTFMKPYRAPVPRGCSAYVLNRDEYWLKPVSNTFHGRDIFAPVAAHLASGVQPEDLGNAVSYVTCLNISRPLAQEDAVQGRVIYVDRFGNLVSNLGPSDISDKGAIVEIESTRIRGLSRSYAGGEGPVAVFGSHGYLEVAVSEGSAAQRLAAGVGTRVRVLSARA